MRRSRQPAAEVPAQGPTPACTCYRGPTCRGPGRGQGHLPPRCQPKVLRPPAPATEVPLAEGHAKVKTTCRRGASQRSYAHLLLLHMYQLPGAMPRSRPPATEVPAQGPMPACTCYRGPTCRGPCRGQGHRLLRCQPKVLCHSVPATEVPLAGGTAEVKATCCRGASPRSYARLCLLQRSHLPGDTRPRTIRLLHNQVPLLEAMPRSRPTCRQALQLYTGQHRVTLCLLHQQIQTLVPAYLPGSHCQTIDSLTTIA